MGTTEPVGTGSQRRVRSADRALAVVDAVAEAGSLTAAEIAARCDLPRSSAHVLLATLVDAGWLEVGPPPRRYRLGLRAWRVGQRYDGHRTLVEAAGPHLDALVATTGETVQLARLDGVHNVYVAIRESPSPMRLVSTVGMRLPAHATGIGKALLSTVDPAEARARLAAAPLARLTPRTLTDVDDVAAVLDDVRRQGFATDDEEYVAGCRCVAVPVTAEAENGLASALSVTMPTARTGDAWPGDLVAPVRAAAAAVRSSLGLPGDAPTAP